MEVEKVHNIDFLKNNLPDKCADLIIADPPYFEVKGEFDFIWESMDEYLSDVEKWAKECKRILKDNGSLYWYGHAIKIAYSQIILDKYFHLLNNLVWRKGDAQTMKISPEESRRYAPVTERILFYQNPPDGFGSHENNYRYWQGMQRSKVMEPIISYLINARDSAGLKNSDIDRLTGTHMSSHWFTRTSQWAFPTEMWYMELQKHMPSLKREYEDLKKEYEELKKEYEELRRPFNNRGKLQLDVLDYSQETHITGKFDHETKKPEKLTANIILTSSRKGDLVVVPFAGSGTECAMAARYGRRFIGFDINDKYVEMSNNRAQKELSQLKLF